MEDQRSRSMADGLVAPSLLRARATSASPPPLSPSSASHPVTSTPRRLSMMKRKESFLLMLKSSSASTRSTSSLTSASSLSSSPSTASSVSSNHLHTTATNKSLWISAGSSWEDFTTKTTGTAAYLTSSSDDDEDDLDQSYWDPSWVDDVNEAENRSRWEEEERQREEAWSQRYEERKRQETVAFEAWSQRWDARKRRLTLRRTVALGKGVIEALGLGSSNSGVHHQRHDSFRRHRSRDEAQRRDAYKSPSSTATAAPATKALMTERSQMLRRSTMDAADSREASRVNAASAWETTPTAGALGKQGHQHKTQAATTAGRTMSEEATGMYGTGSHSPRTPSTTARSQDDFDVTLGELIRDDDDEEEEQEAVWAKEVEDAEKRIVKNNRQGDKEGHQRREQFLSSRRSLTASEKQSLFDEYFYNEEQIWRSRGLRLLISSSTTATKNQNQNSSPRDDGSSSSTIVMGVDGSAVAGGAAGDATPRRKGKASANEGGGGGAFSDNGKGVETPGKKERPTKTKKKKKTKQKEEKRRNRENEEKSSGKNKKSQDEGMLGLDEAGGSSITFKLSQNQVLVLGEIGLRGEHTVGGQDEQLAGATDDGEPHPSPPEKRRARQEARRRERILREEQADPRRKREMEERARLLRELQDTAGCAGREDRKQKGIAESDDDDDERDLTGARDGKDAGEEEEQRRSNTRRRSVSLAESQIKPHTIGPNKRKKRWSLIASKSASLTSAKTDVSHAASAARPVRKDPSDDRKAKRASVRLLNLFTTKEKAGGGGNSSSSGSSSNTTKGSWLSPRSPVSPRRGTEKQQEKEAKRRTEEAKKAKQKMAKQQQRQSRHPDDELEAETEKKPWYRSYRHRRSASMNALVGLLSKDRRKAAKE